MRGGRTGDEECLSLKKTGGRRGKQTKCQDREDGRSRVWWRRNDGGHGRREEAMMSDRGI